MTVSTRTALERCIAALGAVQDLNVQLDYSALTSRVSRQIAEARADARAALKTMPDGHQHLLLTTTTPGIFRCEECGTLVHIPSAK